MALSTLGWIVLAIVILIILALLGVISGGWIGLVVIVLIVIGIIALLSSNK